MAKLAVEAVEVAEEVSPQQRPGQMYGQMSLPAGVGVEVVGVEVKGVAGSPASLPWMTMSRRQRPCKHKAPTMDDFEVRRGVADVVVAPVAAAGVEEVQPEHPAPRMIPQARRARRFELQISLIAQHKPKTQALET